MIGIQALETSKSVVSEYSSKERKPLRNIDVNRSHLPSIPSQDGRNTGKAIISSGFQVFADGETSSLPKEANVKLPVKAFADHAKQMLVAKKPFQTINGTCSKNSTTKAIGQINVEQIAAGSKANDAVCNTKSLFDRIVSTTGAKATHMNWLEKQLAAMHVKEMPHKTQDQVLVTDSYDVKGIENAVPNVIPYFEELHASVRDTAGCARSETLSPEEEPKSPTSDTGAIKKVIPAAACATEVNDELPTFQLNVMAEEWKATPSNTTKGTHDDHGTARDASESNKGVQQLPSFWDLYAHDAQTNLPNRYTDATGTYRHDLPTTTQPTGRKIVGKKLTPFERGQQTAVKDILRELDDRTQEIQRYERYKESRRQKAIEAMRVDQERMKRKLELHQNVPTDVKYPLQPTSATCTNYPMQRYGINGFQLTNNGLHNQMPTLPFAANAPVVKPSVCIIKYPTPPNMPIRYEPVELLKMNYTPRKNNDKRAKKSQEKLKK